MSALEIIMCIRYYCKYNLCIIWTMSTLFEVWAHTSAALWQP